jgi:5-methylthioadenosine/S-adenosylhomocysteine deaminase
VADEALQRVQVLAHELDVPVHIHLHETAAEVQQAVSELGERPFERLRRLGLISPDLIAVHMTQLRDDEIACLADAGAHVVHCPESNLKLASGFCPVAKLRAAGVNVALGTDGAASNNDLDMLGEMHTAALLGKAVANDAAALPAAEVLHMATLGGARALRLDERIGSLEPGKDADLVAIDLGAPESTPVYNPISQIVYSASRQQVRHVWVAGRHLLNDRALTTVDVNSVSRQAAAWRDRISPN